MDLPDTNVWLALLLSNHPARTAARNWFTARSGAGSVLFCRFTMLSTLRLLTTEQVMHPYQLSAMTNDDAWNLISSLFADNRVQLAPEPRDLDATWKSFACRATASPKVWMDAYLAAFAVRSGHRLVTSDRAFVQYKGLDLFLLT
jgi:toxin-antitoxin system PIN domain toxin